MADKRRRPQGRWSEEFKRRIVAEVAASNLSASEIARRNGVNPNLVFCWRKKFGADPRTTGPEKSKEVCLVPVEVEAPPVVAPDTSRASEADVLEIVLPCGTRLRCGSGINSLLLSAALSGLRPKILGIAP